MDADAHIITFYANQALKMPDSFAYSGELAIGQTWGFTPFGMHRDSTGREKYNYQRTVARWKKKYPKDIEEMRSSHWAVGWMEQLLIKVFEDDGTITRAFKEFVRYRQNGRY